MIHFLTRQTGNARWGILQLSLKLETLGLTVRNSGYLRIAGTTSWNFNIFFFNLINFLILFVDGCVEVHLT